jgi:hypothetical protein
MLMVVRINWVKTKKQSKLVNGLQEDNYDEYLDNYAWLEHPLNIEYLDRPKPIKSLPFQQVWVIDNYLSPAIWSSWRQW